MGKRREKEDKDQNEGGANQEASITAPFADSTGSLVDAAASTANSADAANEEAIKKAQQAQEKNNQQLEAKSGAKRGPKPGSHHKGKSRLRQETPAYNARQVGYQMADTLILLGRTWGGESWEPLTQKDAAGTVVFDERKNLREAWADMAEEYKWEKFPAWAGVTICTATYIIPRLWAPSTLSRWDKVKLWFANRAAARQAKIEAERRAKDAEIQGKGGQ